MGIIYRDGKFSEATPEELADFIASIPQSTLAELKSGRIAEVDAKVNAILSTGYPYAADLHVALDDGSRTDLGAMATAAGFAVSGMIPWPESYQAGWIAIENTRIPLPTPEDGIALAAPIGAFYGTVRQNGRTLKNAIIAAEDEAALAAVDIESGWPP